MLRKAKGFALALVVCAGLGAAPAMAADAPESYDLLFRTGTLDSIGRGDALVYRREVVSKLRPDAAERDTGEVVLAFDDGAKDMARLGFRQDGRQRSLGVFPASVGNPMIMYFYETAVRDMAETAGGSPFYIRNRVKDALMQPVETQAGEAVIDGKTVGTTTVRLRPFEGDPNQGRMRGFGGLVLEVTMSDEVPGWYLSLTAEAQDSGGLVYRSALVFDSLEAAQ